MEVKFEFLMPMKLSFHGHFRSQDGGDLHVTNEARARY